MRYATFCLVIRGISQRKMPRITLQANMAKKQRNGIKRKKTTHQFAYPKIYSTFANEKQILSATRHLQQSRRNWPSFQAFRQSLGCQFVTAKHKT